MMFSERELRCGAAEGARPVMTETFRQKDRKTDHILNSGMSENGRRCAVYLPRAPFSFGRLNAGFRPGADICGRGDIMGCGAYRILTNNPLVKERLGTDHRVDFRDIPVEPVFEEAQAYAAAGHELLSHPLGNPALPADEEKALRRKLVMKGLRALTTEVDGQTIFE